ncbi:TPA: hypothetical protein ACHOZE_004409 [Raoultella ornithinolytica]
MSNQDITLINTDDIPESHGFIDVRADSVVTIGTAFNGDETVTLIFLSGYPIISGGQGALSIKGIEKRKVASITMGKNQMINFYNSLKSVYDQSDKEQKG